MFHAGFKEVADAVIEDLEAFLEPGAEVKIAGHSLGGAAAVIVAAKLKLRGYKIGKVGGARENRKCLTGRRGTVPNFDRSKQTHPQPLIEQKKQTHYVDETDPIGQTKHIHRLHQAGPSCPTN